MSMMRDLLFHVQEHQYTLSEIKDLMAAFDYRFLGFNLPSIQLQATYGKHFPSDRQMTDFTNWCQFERHYVGTKVLFDFWLQKPARQERAVD